MPVINIGGGRQTGRTTRMLTEAIAACAGAEKDTAVVVAAHCYAAAERLSEKVQEMVRNGGGRPGRLSRRELLVGRCRLLFITPDDRQQALAGRIVPAEFWDHFAVETVLQDRLRLKDQVYRLMKDVATLKAQRDEAKDDVLKLRLEAAEMCREREKALDSRKAAE